MKVYALLACQSPTRYDPTGYTNRLVGVFATIEAAKRRVDALLVVWTSNWISSDVWTQMEPVDGFFYRIKEEEVHK